jgi:hypothetical protein
MYQFLLDCYFKECYKGRKFGVSTLRYAKRLRAMLHSAESTHIRKYTREIKTKYKNILER